MSGMIKYTIADCFKLRARIGWQGLRSEEFIDFGPYLVTGTDFVNGKIDWDTCYHVNERRYKQDEGIHLRENDLLVTKDGTVGKTAFVVDCPEKATLNSHIFLVRAINGSVAPAYLYYLLNSHAFDVFLQNILTGTTIKGLTQENFYKFSFDAPDAPRQAKIAEVLATVDVAIDKTRTLIEKYNNIKAGMMQDLLGSGAEHTIEDCFRLRARIGWQGLRAEEFTEYGPYLVTGTDFTNGKIKWDTCYHVNEFRFHQDVGIQLKENDLLVTKDGTVGKTAFVVDCPEQATLNSHIFLVRGTNGSVVPAYLYYVLNSFIFDTFLHNILTGTTIKGLTQENFYKFSFRAPSVSKQKEIVDILDTATKRIQNECDYLMKLQDIKRGLMQDLLTNTVSVDALM